MPGHPPQSPARPRTTTWRDALASWLRQPREDRAPVVMPDLAAEERPGRLPEVIHEDRALIEALLA